MLSYHVTSVRITLFGGKHDTWPSLIHMLPLPNYMYTVTLMSVQYIWGGGAGSHRKIEKR